MMLLQWSFKTAKEGLRILAKIGYAGSNKDVEELVVTEVTQTNLVMMRNMRHISKPNTEQKDNENRFRKDRKPRFAKDLLPTEVTMDSSQRRESHSTPSGVEVERVLTKEVEEVEEAKWRKKIANHAGSRTEVEDEEIWERIAFDVRKCGVPVEILRKHEFKTASCIIDTIIDVLRAELQQDQDLSADLDTPSKKEADSAAAEMADRSEADAEFERIAAKPSPAGLNTPADQERVDLSAIIPGSWPDSTYADASEYQGPPEQSTSRLQDLYRHGTSCLKRIIFGSTAPQEGTHCLALDKSLRREKEENFQFDEHSSPRSSVTFLIQDQVKTSTSTETNIQSDCVESLDQEELSTVKNLAGKVSNSRSSTRTDAAASGASVKPSGHIAADDEEEVEVEVIDNDTGKGEGNIDSEDKDFTVDHDGGDVSVTSSDAEKIGYPSSPNSKIVDFSIAGLSSMSSARETSTKSVCYV